MSHAAVSSPRRARRMLIAVVAAYTILIVVVAAYPGPIDRPLEGTVLDLLRLLHSIGLPDVVTYSWVEFGANIGFYVPIAAALAAAVRPGRRWMVIVGLGLVSTTIEVIQEQMPTRVGSLLDVIANTGGALIGVAAVTLWSMWRRRSRTRRAEPASGSLADRGDVPAVPLDGRAEPVLESDGRGPAR